MEEYIGRKLEKGERVVHKNRIKTDNRIENLQVVVKKTEEEKKSLRKKYLKENEAKLRAKDTIRTRIWRENNREKSRVVQQRWRDKNKKKIVEINRKWKKNNPESYKRVIKSSAEKRRKKIKENPHLRIRGNLGSRINELVKMVNSSKQSKTVLLIGCTVNELKMHIESLFTSGMTWENYGKKGWEVDHIIPCNSFDLTKKEEQLKCFHYTNLQPLWAYENQSKGAKLNWKKLC